MDISPLEELGLSRAEIKVYLSLLEIGSTAAGKVVERSGLQNAVVHRALHSLAEKGLLTSIQEGRIRHYQCVEPSLLLTIINDRRDRLTRLIPELEFKKQKAERKTQATLFQGIRGIKELLRLMLETGSKEYYAYGGPQQAHDLLGDYFWENFHKSRVHKKITAQLLFHASLQWWAEKLNKLPHTKVKTTKKDFEEITETIICGKKIAIVIYTEKPYGLLIDDSHAAESYKKFFHIIWTLK